MIDVIDYSSNSTSIISPHTIIDGEIITDGSLEIQGKVKGNISGGLLVKVNNDCIGDFYAQNLILNNNYKIEGNLNIDYDCLIIGSVFGNIMANTIEINGMVKGNIMAEDNIIVRKNAIIDGDIVCKKIQVDSGAIINGNVKLISKYKGC